MRSKKRRRRRLTAKTRAIIAFFCMVFLMGLTIFLWPQIVGVHLGYQAHVAISEFFEMANADNGAEEQPPSVSTEYIPQPTPTARPYADLYRAMCEYNEEIYLNGQARFFAVICIKTAFLLRFDAWRQNRTPSAWSEKAMTQNWRKIGAIMRLQWR